MPIILGMLAGAGCGAPSEEPIASLGDLPDPGDDVASQIGVDEDRRDAACSWTQWGGSAAHGGRACVEGQAPSAVVDHVVYDPFENLELAEHFGVLIVHYQTPLIDENGDYYMLHKGGTYTPCDEPRSGVPFPCGEQRENIVKTIWSESKHRRKRDGSYENQWTFESDWKPSPLGAGLEPMFQPALSGPLLYVPGAGGTVWQVLTVFDRPIALQRINPFDTVDPNTYTVSGVTIDRHGFAYWNVIKQDPVTLENFGFLVKAAPWGQTWKVDYDTLNPNAPAPSALCFASFLELNPRPRRPWPPSADAVPPQFVCGRQRPGLNLTPAIGRDGTIFTGSRADGNDRDSFLLAVNPDLTLKWATSLRGVVNDGCGSPPRDGFKPVFCSTTYSAVGVDPNTNLPPALVVEDVSSSSPVALPDGSVVYGAVDHYTGSRGHLIKLDHNGVPAGNYQFGWDTTPAVYEHDGTYSLVIKDNDYTTPGPFLITQLSKDLTREWSFRNSASELCSRLPDGTLNCVDIDEEVGVEWCVNAPAVDANGNVYANAEDGHVYQIGQGGVQKTKTFLNQALGAAYTPIAIGGDGRVFVLNNGELTVFGR
jgi:outer membrane protein assembly factor BamB